MSILRGIANSILNEFKPKKEERVQLEKVTSTGISVVSFPISSSPTSATVKASMIDKFSGIMHEICIYNPRMALIEVGEVNQKEYCFIVNSCDALKVKHSLVRFGIKHSKIESAETFQERVKPYCDINRTEYHKTSFNEL